MNFIKIGAFLCSALFIVGVSSFMDCPSGCTGCICCHNCTDCPDTPTNDNFCEIHHQLPRYCYKKLAANGQIDRGCSEVFFGPYIAKEHKSAEFTDIAQNKWYICSEAKCNSAGWSRVGNDGKKRRRSVAAFGFAIVPLMVCWMIRN